MISNISKPEHPKWFDVNPFRRSECSWILYVIYMIFTFRRLVSERSVNNSRNLRYLWQEITHINEET